jgi:glycosyltransferase involved in cell wall biosynthesis
MRIAIVHYHLRPGGVTRVIQHTLAALSQTNETIQTIVLTGEPPSPAMPVTPYAVAEELGYNSDPHGPFDQIVDRLEMLVKQALGGMPDVWHFHNHALGKNLLMPALVSHLAQNGQPLLLQIHDFAEDGRPDNYKLLCQHLGDGDPLKLGACLYPQGSHIHYALINQRDLHFLNASGVKAEQLHYLPNAVSMESMAEPESPKNDDDQRLFVYPVRAIRRKNLGELLCWAAIAEKGDRFAVTRAPQNPRARPVYDNWVAFAQAHDLPVTFAVGEHWSGDFSSLLQAADALVTTSVAEGFGLGFLEPWLLNRPLVGRKLPEITDEFEQMGIDLSGLYDRVRVPIAWIDRGRFHQEVQTALPTVYASYGRLMRPDDVNRAVEAAITDAQIDFGRLNEPLQQAVIHRLVKSPSLRKDIVPLDTTGNQQAIMQQNHQLVKAQFNLSAYGRRLDHIYQAVLESESASLGEINADALLDQFLMPQRFCLLRT